MAETVILKSTSFKFLEVVKDSRCPEGVSCIWAGREKVKVAVTLNRKTEEKMYTLFAYKIDSLSNFK